MTTDGTNLYTTDRWTSGRRTLFSAVLATAMATGTFPGYAFGVLGPHLVAEFSLKRFELGLISSVFFLFGALLSLSAGRAVDHFGARRVMLASFMLLAASVLGIAASVAYGLVLVFACMSGIALAVGNPATNKLVAMHIRPGRRGLVIGVKQAGVQLGAFLAGAFLAPLAMLAGWRLALAAMTIIPFAALVTTRWVVPRDHRTDATEHRADWGRAVAGIRWLVGYAFLMGFAAAAVMAYLPLFLVESSHMTGAEAGAVVAVVGMVGIGGRVGWAWATEKVASYWLPLAICGAGGVLGIVLLSSAPTTSSVMAYAAATVLGATAMAWNSVGMMAVLSRSDRQTAGRASGVVLFGFYIGFVSSPLAFGWLADVSGTYLWGWAVAAAAFGCAAATAIVFRRYA